MSLVWYQLVFPAGLETQRAVAWVRSLAARGRAGLLTSTRPLVFELRADAQGVRWFLGTSPRESSSVRRSLESWLPGLAVTPVVALRPEVPSLAVELRLRSQRRSLRSELQPEISRGLLEVLRGLRGSESVVVQWTVGGWLPRRPVPPKSEQDVPHTWDHLLEWGQPQLGSEEVTEARKKQAEQLFACAGRIAVEAGSTKRQRALISRVLGSYQVARTSGAGLSRRSLPSAWVRSRMRRAVVNQVDPPCVLRADELVAVLGWPMGQERHEDLPGVELNRSRQLRPDRRVVRSKEVKDQRVRVVAESAYPSVPGNLVLPAKEALRHLHVLGPTGVGKSTALARLILQDLEAGRGVVVIDPKGDLVDDVVTRLSPATLSSGRVAVLDPRDEAPLGIQPLAGLDASAGVDGVLGVLHSLWASSWGPRLHDVLHAGLLTLAIEPGHSLVELPLLLSTPRFRHPLAAKASERDPLGLGAFWAWFDNLSPEQAAQVLAPVMNKLRAFILRPGLRAVLGQVEPRFDLSRVVTDQHALLVRLPRGELGGEAAALLGSLVFSQVWQAIQGRSASPARSRRPVFVYLDEFQEFVRLPLDLGDALAQARGLGAGLVLAHQHLGQLSTDVRAGVLANTGSRMAFRLDHEDGTVIAKRSGGRLKAEDFTDLPPFHAYADLVAESAPRGFASARTRPLPPAVRGIGGVRAANRRAWGVPRSETEAHLRSLLDGSGSGTTSSGETFGVMPSSGSQS